MDRMPLYRLDGDGKSLDMRGVTQLWTGACAMFVRAVWRSKRAPQSSRPLREVGLPSSRNAGIIGVCAPDFPNMTRGLFDRRA
jgi:hypothetical protein